MIKKENTQKEPEKKEKVKDIYGVHFQYKDLYSRLLKVQKQRRHSEIKSSITGLSTIDSTNPRAGSAKPKAKLASIRPNTNQNIKIDQNNNRSTSTQKSLTRQPLSNKKLAIFKSFSPSRRRKKFLKNKAKKPIDKKLSASLCPAKKQPLKPKNS